VEETVEARLQTLMLFHTPNFKFFMFNDKKHCFHEFCDSSNVTYEHCNSVNDYEDHYNEMMKEEWLGDAVDDLCNLMTDSSPADNVVNVYSSRNNNTSRSSKPVSTQQMVTGEMTVGTMNNNNYSSNNYSISNTVRVFSNSKLFSYSKIQRIADCIY